MSSPAKILYRLSRAGVKAGLAVFRSAGALHSSVDFAERKKVCATCPLYVQDKCGKAYCGKPFLKQIERDEPTEGCGCPIDAKARDPSEHCPRDRRFNAPARDEAGACSCMWCTVADSKAARAVNG
jgi:hypothetical protein